MQSKGHNFLISYHKNCDFTWQTPDCLLFYVWYSQDDDIKFVQSHDHERSGLNIK